MRPDTDIMGVSIHRTDHLLFSIRQLSVKVTLVQEDTGEKLDKQNIERKAISFYENEGSPISKVMEVMTQPFRVRLVLRTASY